MPEPTRPTADGARGQRWVAVYAVLVMVLGTGAFVTLVERDVQSLVFALWGCAYLVAALGLLNDRFVGRRAVSPPPTLVAFTALAGASVLWSVGPELSLRRSLGLAGTAVVGLFLARRLAPVDLFDAVRRAVLIIAVTSLLLYASGSAVAVDDVHGTLRGVLVTKNTLGRVLALGVLAAAAVGLLDRTRWRRAVVSGAIMLGTLAMTDSTGGALVAAMALIVAGTVAVVGQRRGRIATAGVVAVLLGAGSVLLPGTTADDAAEAIGEDATLTGRTEIWENSLQALADRPVLGYGYGAFWHEEMGAVESDRIRARLQWDVPSAHNGLLDVGLDLGLVGAALAVALLLSLLVRGVRDLSAARFQAGVLRLSVLALVVVSNAAESGLLLLNSLQTVLLVAAVAAREPAGTTTGRTSPGRVAPGSPAPARGPVARAGTDAR